MNRHDLQRGVLGGDFSQPSGEGRSKEFVISFAVPVVGEGLRDDAPGKTSNDFQVGLIVGIMLLVMAVAVALFIALSRRRKRDSDPENDGGRE
jgi:hypothetical protein